MLLQTSEDDINGTISEYQFIDSITDVQPPPSGSLIFASQITPLNNEMAFQEDFVSSSLDFGFSYIVEPQLQLTDSSMSEGWKSENIQPTKAETWLPVNIQSTTVMTPQLSDMQKTTVAAPQPLDKPLTAVRASQLNSNFSPGSQGDTMAPIATKGSIEGNQLLSNLEPYVCGICGDRATGKHYGAVSCDGCKGFFRRSVRKSQEYICRFKRGCIITKDRRNQCRYCRLKKCFSAGMKKAAVQNERDKISYRRSTRKQNQNASMELTISNLLQAEEQNQELPVPMVAGQVASITDICNSMKEELLRFIDWAKKLPGFLHLSPNDREILLKNRGAEHLILGVAKRSLNRHDSLLLGNTSVILKEMTNTISIQSDDITRIMQSKVDRISNRIWREVIQPWQSTNMDDVEFACLKIIVLFDPYAKGLADTERVETLRSEVQINLENYISDRQYEGVGRLCKLLLTLISLQSISREMADEILYAEVFHGVQVDDILQDMLLGGVNKPYPVI